MTQRISDEKIEWIRHLYVDEMKSLRAIARITGISKTCAAMWLKKLGIPITMEKDRMMTPEARRRSVETRKRNIQLGITPTRRGFKFSIPTRYKLIRSQLNFSLPLEWYMQFEYDILIFLNKVIKPRNLTGISSLSEEYYKEFIEHFYNDERFIKLYAKWKETGNSYMKPSLDHIIPVSKGGSHDISNLQFVTWLENFAKCDIDQDEWDKMKQHLDEYFV